MHLSFTFTRGEPVDEPARSGFNVPDSNCRVHFLFQKQEEGVMFHSNLLSFAGNATEL